MIRQYVKPIHYLHFMKFAETPSKIIFSDGSTLDGSTFIAEIDALGHTLIKLELKQYKLYRGEKDDDESRKNARWRSETEEAIVKFEFRGKIFDGNICATIETVMGIYNVVVLPNYEKECIEYMAELYKKIIPPAPPGLPNEIRVVSPPPPPLLGLEDDLLDIVDLIDDLDPDERMDSPIDEE